MKAEIIDSIEQLILLPEWEDQIFFFPDNTNSGASLLALGKKDMLSIHSSENGSLDSLHEWITRSSEWSFGIIGYDTKNLIEKLSTPHIHPAGLPLIHFVKPRVIIRFKNDHPELLLNTSSLTDRQLLTQLELVRTNKESVPDHIELMPRTTRSEYIDNVHNLLHHIQRGDIYEVNYCQEFFAEKKLSNPFHTWLRLNTLTDAPHACYVRTGHKYLLCASPERYLKREEKKVISQPIKGTIRRGKDAQEDNRLKEELLRSKKERSENVMIVDLVRNDLSRHAEQGSVRVEKLFEVQSFRTVHHLVSTVSALVDQNVSFTQLLRATFPMGSMTGAPKIRAMQLIAQYEHTTRGWYSGCAGYIRPDGDFDFNVVIRSLVYDESIPYLSCSVGSAITIQSDPEHEYEECLLKAAAILQSLQ